MVQLIEEKKSVKMEFTKKKFSKKWLDYFEQLAPSYSKYRKRFNYYWGDTIKYYNYYLTDEDSILQIGCSTGDTLGALKGGFKTGIDFSTTMIEEAKKSHPSLDFHVMAGEDLVLDRKYDVIILSNVVGYFDNVLDVFSQLKNCSHDRTKIFVNYYSRLWQPILNLAETLGLKKKSPNQNWLSKLDLENLLYLAGYESYRTNMRMLLPINIPIISYLLNKYLARLPILNNLCLSQYIFAKKLPEISAETDKKYSVSVVIPARNESGNIENAILNTPEMGKWTELIFIEGNSTDDTWEKIQEMHEKYKGQRRIKIGQQPGKGKYDAVKRGYDDFAEGDILMILDADLTVPPEDLSKFYEAIASGKGEFINGSRLVYPMEKKAMRFLNLLGNKFFSYCFSWLLEQPIKDTLCGTKVMFRTDYLKLAKNRKFFGDFDPFGDFDLLFGSYKLNLKIIDLPIRYRERVYGDTNISRFRHGLILLRMVMFALNKIKFY